MARNAAVLSLDDSASKIADLDFVCSEDLQGAILNQLKEEISTYAEGAVECWDLVAERLCFFAGEVKQ